jgi:hypothetical protein
MSDDHETRIPGIGTKSSTSLNDRLKSKVILPETNFVVPTDTPEQIAAQKREVRK